MNMHVQIEMFGGPEDGREVTVPLLGDGGPVSPLPVPSPLRSAEIVEADAQVAWYERDHVNARGSWVYRHSNVVSRQHTETH